MARRKSETGDRMKRLIVLVLVLAGVAGGAYWSFQLRKPATEVTAARATGRNAAAVTSVVTAPVTSGDFPVRLKSIGNVEAVATVAVKSRVQSQLLVQHFVDGQMVNAGDLLFSLDDRELSAQVAKDKAALQRDQATLTRNQADFARAQQLFSKSAGTQQALDSATADVATTTANIASDTAALQADELRLSYTKIYSPITGRTGAATVTPGNLINASDTGPGMVTVTQVKPVRISFTLPERDLPQIRAAMAGDKSPVVRAFLPEKAEAETGQIIFVDSTINVNSGTIVLKAEFANDDLGLWPGQYLQVEVQLGVHPDALSLPTVAMQQGQNGSYVYVVGADSTAVLRNVKSGLVDGDRTEIVSGLQVGDRVIVDGQLRLANGARVVESNEASQKADTKS